MTAFAKAVWVITRKDILVEARTKEILFTTMFFAVACVLVFAFGFVKEGVPVSDAAAGILWIAIAFAGTLALGKLVGILMLLGAVEAIVVPLVALMFQAALFDHALLMLALLAAGTIGFAAVGTLFAAMLVRARSRDVMLPVLLYPITVPVIIAGVRGTAALLQPEGGEPMARAWLAMLVFFDVVFITLALWTFEPVMTE